MSGAPFPEEPEEGVDREFREAMKEIIDRGWKPIGLVVPFGGSDKGKAHVAALALEYELPVTVDPERDPGAGIGIRYEAEVLDENAIGPGAVEDLADEEEIDTLLDDGQEGESWRKPKD